MSAEFSFQIAEQIKVTPEATDQLRQLVEAEEGVQGVRLFVYGGGCSGMSYGVTFVESPAANDCVLEQDGLKVFVDPVALNFLEGVEVDYRVDGLNRSLVFNNVFQRVGGGGVCGGCGAAGGGCA